MTKIGANIIEAKASSSKRDYIRFFEISLKSANETEYWLIPIENSNSLHINNIEYLKNELKEIANIIGVGILTMKNKR